MERLAVLLVHDEYNASQGEISINPKLGGILKENAPDIPVFSTVLKATEEDKQDAQQDGVELLLPKLDPGDPRTDPSLDWLTFDHRVKYPHLPPKIGSIVGHAGVTSRAAVRIKQERYPDTRVILFSSDIPEDTEYYKGDEKAMGIGKKEDSILEDAQEADVVFSLGNKIFDHFQIQFKAIPNSKRPQHFKFVPRCSKLFEDAQAEYSEAGTMVVVSIVGIEGVELAAEALSIVAEKMNIKWRVRVINKNDFEKINAILMKLRKSSKLQITLLPYGTQKDICKDMMQAHLVLMPSCAEPFGLVGLDAITAGVPVLVSSRSGLAGFIHEHVDELHHSIVDMDGGEEGATAKLLAQSIERMLKHNKTEFKTAATCKQQLLSTKYWEKSHEQFIKACVDAGNGTQQTGQAQRRKRSAGEVEETDESRKDSRKDMSGLGELWFMYKRGKLNDLLVSSLISKETLQQLCAESVSVKATINIEDFRKVLVCLLTPTAKGQPIPRLPQEFPLYQPHTHTTSNVLDVLHLDDTTLTRSSGEGDDLEMPLTTQERDSQHEFETKLASLYNAGTEQKDTVSTAEDTEAQVISSIFTSADVSGTQGGPDTQVSLTVLLAKLNAPEVRVDKAQQFDLYCQIGDLYRTKLQNLQSALQYYQYMLECSQALSEETKQAKAYSRLGLTCDILGLQQDAFRNHERALAIYRVETKNETDICVAYKNLASSLALSGQVSDAKTNYESALAVAMETGNKTEQMDIYCMLGDLHREQLHEPQISHGYYSEMLTLARDLRRKDRERLAYNRLGLTCGDMQDNEAALEWHQKHLKMSQDDGDKKEQITAHTCVGDTYRLLGKLDQATSHFNTALQMAQQTGDQHGQMNVYFWMGDMHMEQLHSPHTAIQYYEQHLALARQLMDRDEEGVAYNKLGLAHDEMGKYETALEWHQKNLKMSQDDGDKKEQITAHINVGNTYRRLGKLDQATSHFNTALQMAQQTGDQHGQMDVYCKMGEMHREQLHSPHTAIQYYEQHLALARQLMDRHEEGLAYNRLGRAHYEMGEYEAALEWYQKYLKMSQDDGDKKEQITAHINVGNAYRRLGKLDLATSHFNTALQMAQQTGDQHGQMKVYFWMGDMHSDQLHSPRTAIQYYEQHLALARQLMDRYEERVAYNRLGVAHYEMGEYETALEWFQKDLKMSQESGNKTEETIAYQCIGDSYKGLGKLDLARSHYQSAMAIAMETRNKQEQEDIAKRLAELQ
ncbi:TTC28 [Branchiostoma lanceolatum]|uniref:TTC28 protein n=1 Tax=Branchiostoma lanceolatum TaxID=7740 RepID=A0A8J9ZBL9_BRALA|nr:TTC28 [Branchiostoma lanceolatum]